ncbi:MAG: DUF4860 domain-containing protein [Gracilibacteraceae bacterium]|jgi:hypothetical protein|nr:DUF4860 domain-containing protein [Gracilibacteraceae bacterium]
MERRGHLADTLFLLALFGVLAASALFVVMTGTNVYRQTVTRMDDHFDLRTPLAYVTAKVRQSDDAGAVYLAELGGGPALVLEQVFGDSVYQTWIYYHEGALKEVLLEKGAKLEPSYGLAIMETPGFSMERVEDGLLRFTALDASGGEMTLELSLRSS